MDVCDCSDFHWTCSANKNVTETVPGRWITNTTDVLFDVGDLNINEWILQTHNNFISTRFGGWSSALQPESEVEGEGEPEPETEVKFENPQAKFQPQDYWINGTSKKLIAWYNNDNRAFHALPAYTSAIHNAMLRSLVGNEDSANYGISTFSHPLTLLSGQIDAQSL